MWNPKSQSLILNAVRCNESIESNEFNQAIADIQDWLGQNDGSFASLYFADYQQGGWEGLSPNERLVVISGYIRNEINELAICVQDRMDESLEIPEVPDRAAGAAPSGQGM